MKIINNVPKFWWVKQYIIDKGYDVGHDLFSIGHLIWIAIIISICIIVSKHYKKASKEEITRFRKICALLFFFLEYTKIVAVLLIYPQYGYIYPPLHLCSFAGIFILIDALFPNKKIINSLWLYVFLLSGILGVISPSPNYPWINFFGIHEFLFHGLLVVYSIFKIAIGESKPRYIGIWVSTLFVAILMVPIYYIDVIFDKGFMFLTTPADFPLTNLIWNLTTPIFGIMGYISTLLLLGVITFHIIHLIAVLIEKIKKIQKKEK